AGRSRLLGARGWLAAQQAFDADVLVDLLPLDCIAERHDLPLGALLRRRVPEPRQPPQWRGDSTAVPKGDDQLRLSAIDRIDLQSLILKLQSAHAMPSASPPCAP